MTPVIEINGLRKTYQSRRGGPGLALDGLDLLVEPGQVHGFLGPNGSGKTTTLRILLGLVRADSGRIHIFGEPVPERLPQIINQIGAIVESPRFFENFTARRTLRLLATAGGVRRRRVDEVLELVGLRDRAKERVKTFSLGMKQRLAVAAALLKQPRLLILDEPVNGLDPAGIHQMRDLIRNLTSEGVTVLLSSHILAEVQQICDSVSIISRGRRVAYGRVADVLARYDKGDVRVKAADLATAAKIISDAGLPVQVYDDHMIVSDLADPAWITETLAKRRIFVSELTPLMPDLESVFLSLTGTAPRQDGYPQVDESVLPPSDFHAAPVSPPTVTAPSSPGPVLPHQPGSSPPETTSPVPVSGGPAGQPAPQSVTPPASRPTTSNGTGGTRNEEAR